MPKLTVNLLGTFQVIDESQPGEKNLNLGYDKARALFAFLTTESGRPHRRDALAGLLWPEMPDSDALHNLRLAIYTLRRALAEPSEQKPDQQSASPAFLCIDAKTIACLPDESWQLDVAHFLEAITIWEKHQHPPLEACDKCLPGLEYAAHLYRGEFLAGFFLDSSPFEEWILIRRERLRQKALAVLHILIAVMNQKSDYPAAIDYARQILSIEPWDEDAYCVIMKSLAATGQRRAALAQYTALSKILADELGTEPGEEARQVYTWLLEAEPAETAFQWSGLIGPASDPSWIFTRFSQSIFRPASSFVGRAEELETIKTAFLENNHHLLVILGTGGLGKSRLAIQAALRLEASFRDGICWIPLSGVMEPDLVIPAMLSALQVNPTSQEGTRKQLAEVLKARQILLVIDNLEHLIVPEKNSPRQSIIHLFAEILSAAPQVYILATSRTRLNCPGEQVLELHGLDTPDEEDVGEGIECNSLQLFLESARRTVPSFAVTWDMLPALMRICRYLEGIPLSLELAAAWLRVLSPVQIEEALHSDIGLLVNSQAEFSLNPVFERSWKLLPEEEQTVFAKLSIFRGSFDQEAATAVAGASLFHLASLVDHSLLWRSQTGRFYIHEQLRQYAFAKLDQNPEEAWGTAQRFVIYFIDYVANRAPLLTSARERGEPPRILLPEMEIAIDNLRLCARMLLSSQENLLGIAASNQMQAFFSGLGLFYEYQGRYQEAARLYRSAIEWFDKGVLIVDKHSLAHWHNCLAQAYFNLGDYRLSLSSYQEALSCLDKRLPETRPALWGGILSQALQQAVRRLGLKHPWQRPHNLPRLGEELIALIWTSVASLRCNRLDLLVYSTLRLINTGEVSGSTDGAATGYIALSFTLSFIGFYPLALVYYQLAEASLLKIENVPTRAGLHAALGRFCMQTGLFDRSVRELEQAAFLYKKLNDYRQWIETVNAWITALHAKGDFLRIAELWKQQVEIAHRNGDRFYQGVALGGLAVVSVRLGEYDQALEYCVQALSFIEETPWLPRQVILLAVQSLALLRLGQVDRAQLSLEAGVQAVTQEPPRIFLMGEGISVLLETALAMQEAGISEVRRHTAVLLRVMKRHVKYVPAYTLRLWYYRGTRDWLSGRPRRALKAWKKSLELSQQMDLPYEQARAHWEIGRHLPTENPEHHEHLEAAYELFRKLNLPNYPSNFS